MCAILWFAAWLRVVDTEICRTAYDIGIKPHKSVPSHLCFACETGWDSAASDARIGSIQGGYQPGKAVSKHEH